MGIMYNSAERNKREKKESLEDIIFSIRDAWQDGYTLWADYYHPMQWKNEAGIAFSEEELKENLCALCIFDGPDNLNPPDRMDKNPDRWCKILDFTKYNENTFHFDPNRAFYDLPPCPFIDERLEKFGYHARFCYNVGSGTDYIVIYPIEENAAEEHLMTYIIDESGRDDQIIAVDDIERYQERFKGWIGCLNDRIKDRPVYTDDYVEDEMPKAVRKLLDAFAEKSGNCEYFEDLEDIRDSLGHMPRMDIIDYNDPEYRELYESLDGFHTFTEIEELLRERIAYDPDDRTSVNYIEEKNNRIMIMGSVYDYSYPYSIIAPIDVDHYLSDCQYCAAACYYQMNEYEDETRDVLIVYPSEEEEFPGHAYAVLDGKWMPFEELDKYMEKTYGDTFREIAEREEDEKG